MKILMMTNTYHPIVGGLERSVEILTKELRDRGHEALIVAPEFEDAPEEEEGVVRLPAIQHFNGTDFSVELPIPSKVSTILDDFNPDIVHTHHPFLIGDTALRVSAKYDIPLVFTHHTLYERYTHYVPGDSQTMKNFVMELTKGYANLCDHVIAPSQSIERMLIERGVEAPMSSIPTGIYCDDFQKGDRKNFRKFFDVADDVFLFGTLGRVAKEKNIDFLSDVAINFLKQDDFSMFLCVGSGPDLERIRKKFKKQDLSERIITPGVLKGSQLISAYKAMDVFVFASHTETQGLVLAEAMASGVPVIAVDAPGVREILKDGRNGRMFADDNMEEFLKALSWVKKLDMKEKKKISSFARKTSIDFSVDKSVEKVLNIYEQAIEQGSNVRQIEDSLWKRSQRLISAEAELIFNVATAAGTALFQIPRQAVKNLTISIAENRSEIPDQGERYG